MINAANYDLTDDRSCLKQREAEVERKGGRKEESERERGSEEGRNEEEEKRKEGRTDG